MAPAGESIGAHTSQRAAESVKRRLRLNASVCDDQSEKY